MGIKDGQSRLPRELTMLRPTHPMRVVATGPLRPVTRGRSTRAVCPSVPTSSRTSPLHISHLAFALESFGVCAPEKPEPASAQLVAPNGKNYCGGRIIAQGPEHQPEHWYELVCQDTSVLAY
jgi:hypothetical protein